MPEEIADKAKGETYYKCTHCGDEIFWNTHKKLTYCKCKKIWVDGCEYYVRIGGNEVEVEWTPYTGYTSQGGGKLSRIW